MDASMIGAGALMGFCLLLVGVVFCILVDGPLPPEQPDDDHY